MQSHHFSICFNHITVIFQDTTNTTTPKDIKTTFKAAPRYRSACELGAHFRPFIRSRVPARSCIVPLSNRSSINLSNLFNQFNLPVSLLLTVTFLNFASRHNKTMQKNKLFCLMVALHVTMNGAEEISGETLCPWGWNMLEV